jgi:AcrR family transcriptional regulator
MVGSGQQPTPRAGRSARRRRELLDAADRVVMRDGPEASMNAIAAEAGVTKPILYRHFGDKNGLYRALAEQHIAELLDILHRAMATPGGRRSRTVATIDAYLAMIESRPQLYRFLMHHAGTESADVRSQVALFIRRLGEELSELIMVNVGLNEADRPKARAWAHGVVGMVQAAADWWLEEQPCPRAEMVGHLADLLGGALADTGASGRMPGPAAVAPPA